MFGKNADTGEYVFFVVDSRHPKYTCVKNTVDQQNYVAEFVLDDYPITEDVITSYSIHYTKLYEVFGKMMGGALRLMNIAPDDIQRGTERIALVEGGQ